MYCRYCGKQVKDGSKFCPYCGKSLNETVGKEHVKSKKKSGAPKGWKIVIPVFAVVLLASSILIIELLNRESAGDTDSNATSFSGSESAASKKAGGSGNVLMSERDSVYFTLDDAGNPDYHPSYKYENKDRCVFGSDYLCEDIAAVTFLDTLDDMPADAWDVSENKDGSVMAWLELKDEADFEDYYGDAPYELYIAGEGGVDANADSYYLFGYYDNLCSVDFNDCFYTGNVTDMNYMFYECTSLKALDVSNFDTSSVENMSFMFSECTSLKTLDVSNFDTSSVEDMSYMFSSCNSLEMVDVSNFNTSKVTDMRGMFSSCENVTELDLSNFDTSNVTDMRVMFFYCWDLEALDVSNFDTSNVTNMSYMFSECTSLKTLDVSNFDTSSVEDMSDMFSRCTSLETLDVSNFDTSSVKNMSEMFYKCTSLETLDVSNFDTSSVKNMSEMFSGCWNLETLDVSNFDTSSVEDMSDIFSNCPAADNMRFDEETGWYSAPIEIDDELGWIDDELGWIDDELGWFSSPSIVESAMINFYDNTGVQLYLIISDNINGEGANLTASTAESYLSTIYDSLFDDESHMIFAFIEYEASKYGTYIYCGTEAASIIDSEARDVILNLADLYYEDTSLSDERYFAKIIDESAQFVKQRLL